MSKKKQEASPTGMNWRLVSQNVAIGVAIIILGWLAFALGLQGLPFVGVLFANFAPLAFVAALTFFRSAQRTKGQAIAESAFAGFVFLAAMTLLQALFSFLNPPAA